MKTITSISGGKTSAYLSAKYFSSDLVFSLVRTSDKKVQFKDKQLRKIVSEKIQADFIGTLEDDTIIYTILDLEQYLGKKINWVSGKTFEDLIKYKGGYLPNIATRFCTTELKMRPIFHWWAENYNFEPCLMNIGFRATEKKRADKMNEKLNKNNLSEFKATFEKNSRGQNKWGVYEWRRPNFPLIKDNIYKTDVNRFWQNKPVRFADYNNCVGCFHRSAAFLKEMSEADKDTFDWFVRAEENNKGFFKKNI